MIERDLDYHPITGPAVDRYNSRKDGDMQWVMEENLRKRLNGPITSANPDYDRPIAAPGQSKKWSRIEAGAGTLIGFIIGVMGNILLLPLVTIELGVGITAAVTLTLAFMVLSYVRQYSLRRFFNWLQFRRV